MRKYKVRLLFVILMIGGFSWLGITSTVRAKGYCPTADGGDPHGDEQPIWTHGDR